MTEPGDPHRELVRAPTRTAATRRTPLLHDLHEGGESGTVLLRSLIRAQLGLAVIFLVLAAALLASLPLVASLLPGLAGRDLFGLPLPLVVLGIAVHPVLVVLGWSYVRVAERVERRFVDLVDRP